jgi:molybdopterin-guanine dinucleotide biosynthesis protein A
MTVSSNEGKFPGFNAVILAGGRSSRLEGEPKALLRVSGRTLLGVALEASAGASTVAVAGPDSLSEVLREAGTHAVLVREDPPFSGPAAAVATAFKALLALDAEAGRRTPDWTLVLACDMPFIAAAVETLLAEGGAEEARAEAAGDGTTPGSPPESLVALDETGRAQPLAALYRSVQLDDTLRRFDRPGGLVNLSMKTLLARVQRRDVRVPAHSTADVDTWEDARRWSVEAARPAQT